MDASEQVRAHDHGRDHCVSVGWHPWIPRQGRLAAVAHVTHVGHFCVVTILGQSFDP